MEAGQPQKGGQVLPQVDPAGHDPVSAKPEGGQQELPSIVSSPSGKGPGGASPLDRRNGSHGSSPDFSRASSAAADLSGLGGEGGQHSLLSVQGFGSSAKSIVSYQQATGQQQTDGSSRSVSAMDVYTSLFSGREYDASETLQGRGYRPATTIEGAHTHLTQADHPASRKKVRKEPGALGQQHQKHLSASYPRAARSSHAGRADYVALDLVDTALLRTATPPAILPRQNNVRAARGNVAEGRALEYAIEVESRLRSELLEAREALSMERARTSALSKRLRELNAGHAGGGGPRPHTTAVRKRGASVRLGEAAGEGFDGGGEGNAPDDDGDDGLTSVASKLALTEAHSLASTWAGGPPPSLATTSASMSPSARLEERCRRKRPAAHDKMTMSEMTKGMGKHAPALLQECMQHIETSLRTLEEAQAARGMGASQEGRGASPGGREGGGGGGGGGGVEGGEKEGGDWVYASKARLRVFEVCFDALISSFRVYGPLLSTIKAEYDRAVRAMDTALQEAIASKVNPAAEQQLEIQALTAESRRQMKLMEERLHQRQEVIGEYAEKLRVLEEDNQALLNQFKAAIIKRRRSEFNLAEAQLFGDKALVERQQLQGMKAGQISLKLRLMQAEEDVKAAKGQIHELEVAAERMKEELQATQQDRDRHKLHAETYINKFDTFEHYYGKEEAKKRNEISLSKAREAAFEKFANRQRREAAKDLTSIQPKNDARNMSEANVPLRSLGSPQDAGGYGSVSLTAGGRKSSIAPMGGERKFSMFSGAGLGGSSGRRSSIASLLTKQ